MTETAQYRAAIDAASEAVEQVLSAALRGPGAGRFDAREIATAALEAVLKGARQASGQREIPLVAVVEAEVYVGMSDAQVAKEFDREVVYRAGLQGITEVRPAVSDGT